MPASRSRPTASRIRGLGAAVITVTSPRTSRGPSRTAASRIVASTPRGDASTTGARWRPSGNVSSPRIHTSDGRARPTKSVSSSAVAAARTGSVTGDQPSDRIARSCAASSSSRRNQPAFAVRMARTATPSVVPAELHGPAEPLRADLEVEVAQHDLQVGACARPEGDALEERLLALDRHDVDGAGDAELGSLDRGFQANRPVHGRAGLRPALGQRVRILQHAQAHLELLAHLVRERLRALSQLPYPGGVPEEANLS